LSAFAYRLVDAAEGKVFLLFTPKCSLYPN
jgi:hypothetical protein